MDSSASSRPVETGAPSGLPELALGTGGAVERERRRLIEIRVIAPVSTPAAPLSVACRLALLTDGEEDV